MLRGPLSLCLLLLLATISPHANAAQNCGQPGGKTLTIASPIVLSSPYDPTSITAASIPGTIQIIAPYGLGPCVAWITLSPGQPGGMSGPGGAHLSYGFSGAFWTAANAILNITDDANGNSPPAPGGLIISPGQRVPAGTYSETRTVVIADASARVLSRQSLFIQATVTSSCTLPAPATAHLDFSAGVRAARPTAGYTQSTIIDGASCSGPAVLTLRGAPMKTGTAANGFKASIDYTATATFSNATAMLATATASQATTALNAPTGRLTVSVALVDGGTPLAAGTYSSLLSIVLEPAN